MANAHWLRQTRRTTKLVTVLAAGTALALSLLASPANAAPAGLNGAGMSPNSAALPASINYSNEQAAWDFFLNKKMWKVRIAAIIGNLDQESGMDPTIAQYGGGPGRGIAQWSVGGRWDTYSKDNVVWYAGVKRASPWSLDLQLQFIWYELQTYPYDGLPELRSAHTINDATIAFQNYYEGCGDCNTAARESYAQAAYNRYA